MALLDDMRRLSLRSLVASCAATADVPVAAVAWLLELLTEMALPVLKKR